MKLSARTVQILRNFASINPSIQFNAGDVLRTISPNKTMMAKAKLEDTIDADFAIYDLSRFLGVSSLFDSPEYEIEERLVRIKSDGRSVSYTFADPSTIVTPPNKDIVIGEFDVEFDITSEILSEIQKAIGVMSFSELTVVGEDGKVLLRATDTKNPSSDKYDIEVGETEKEFVAVFKTENLKILNQNYHVGISSKGISHFESDDVEYWISIESNSSF